ncbi:sensor domain-containing diguanylate cyclase [Litchfieldia alkalitelluris]|uniref:sensor domain-containing diguanylate cyclase n=1 Tax=Litchfieldia alkalitelluris TaxID=304268 RepID=UPI0014759573|nr:sensor domain-containing diguanylate cyclase [Litchfieldia alkalitelluris]
MTSVLLFSTGFIFAVFVLMIYISFERKNAREKFESEKRTYQLLESSKDVIYHYDILPEFKFRYISPSLDYILGKGIVEKGYINPYSCFENIHPDDYQTLFNKVQGTIDYSQPILQRWSNNQGEYIWFEEYTSPIYEHGKLVAIKGVMRNITDKIKLQQDLEYQISHDHLTGLYNRSYISKQMEFFDKKEDVPIAFIICDLDNLKQINDRDGHRKGDQLIAETAKILNSVSSENVIVARLGGDEFSILITSHVEEAVEELIQNIIDRITHYNENHQLTINLSLGFAYHHSSFGHVEKLFYMADERMYENKNKRKMLA